MKWAYGVTTVPCRRWDLLPITLKSLANGGFDKPRLFVDGYDRNSDYNKLGLDVTLRYPTVRTYGNWWLALNELFTRNPEAERFALFQDDLVTYKNLRAYLERLPYPKNGYCNLYNFPENEALCDGRKGWYPADQLGRGAVGLVFDVKTARSVLLHPEMIDHLRDAVRGWKSIDGTLVTAMKQIGVQEMVHYPSLLQHTGRLSSMRNSLQKLSESFRGEDYDALELLP